MSERLGQASQPVYVMSVSNDYLLKVDALLAVNYYDILVILEMLIGEGAILYPPTSRRIRLSLCQML